MDFLPQPRGCAPFHAEIPCLATIPFDGGDLETFPSRTPWGSSRTVAVWSQIFKQPPADFSAFLQTWLYFGLLELIFNRRVTLQQFTQKSSISEKLVLNTLPLKEWFGDTKKIDGAAKRLEVLGQIGTIHANFYLKKILVTDPDFKLTLQEYVLHGCFHDPRDPLIVASIGILLEVGREYLMQSIPHSDRAPNERIFLDMEGLMGGGIFAGNMWTNSISSRLREYGWCPSEITMMERRLNTSGLYFMSQIPRPHQSRRHQMVRIHSDVENTTSVGLCSETRCRFLQINQATYHTKHHRDCKQSKCWNMSASSEEVLEILRTGSIPLIAPISDDYRSDEITLVSSKPDFTTPYIAISHVWSDGLGNLQRSALPRCQLLHLSMLVRNLARKYFSDGIPIYFWIDTIGCPPDDVGQTQAQGLAISFMPQTYGNATAVLVLDAWLQETEISQLPHHEVLLRIICCNWNSRLWTLQEGALARNLVFQFADMAYNVNQGLSSLKDCQDRLLNSTLRSLIEERIYEIQAFSHQKGNRQSRLIALTGALSNRSTSVLSDEAICLATLLKFSASESRLIYHAPPEDRMRVFWSLIENVSGRFLQDSFPRLRTSGYHWAPRTFLMEEKTRLPIIAPTVDMTDIFPKRTASGLIFRGSGLILFAGDEAVGEHFFLLDEHNRKYVVNCDMSDARHVVRKSAASYYATVDLEHSSIDETDLQEVALGEMRQIKLSESYGTGGLAIIFLHKEKRKFQRSPVVLAALQRSHRGVNYCRFICGGSCSSLEGPEFGKIEDINPPLPEYVQLGKAKLMRGRPIVNSSGTLSFVRGVKFPPEQQWCLD